MNRAGLIVVVAALIVAVATALTPAQAQGQAERTGSATIAAIVDASITNADTLGLAAKGERPLASLLSGRDVQVIEVDQLVDGRESEMLGNLLSSSKVLDQNILGVRAAVAGDPALRDMLAAHEIDAERLVAVDLVDDTAQVVTIYLFRQ